MLALRKQSQTSQKIQTVLESSPFQCDLDALYEMFLSVRSFYRIKQPGYAIVLFLERVKRIRDLGVHLDEKPC